MNRIELLRKELDHTFDQESWYPPLQPALEGLTAAQASWRPAGEAANTIWETVNHMLYYKERLLKRLQGKELEHVISTNDGTYEVSSPDDEAAWAATVKRAEAIHRELQDVLATLNDDAFDRPSPQPLLGEAVLNIIMHDAYHTGQIIQIRKLQGSWVARRSFE